MEHLAADADSDFDYMSEVTDEYNMYVAQLAASAKGKSIRIPTKKDWFLSKLKNERGASSSMDALSPLDTSMSKQAPLTNTIAVAASSSTLPREQILSMHTTSNSFNNKPVSNSSLSLGPSSLPNTTSQAINITADRVYQAVQVASAKVNINVNQSPHPGVESTGEAAAPDSETHNGARAVHVLEPEKTSSNSTAVLSTKVSNAHESAEHNLHILTNRFQESFKAFKFAKVRVDAPKGMSANEAETLERSVKENTYQVLKEPLTVKNPVTGEELIACIDYMDYQRHCGAQTGCDCFQRLKVPHFYFAFKGVQHSREQIQAMSPQERIRARECSQLKGDIIHHERNRVGPCACVRAHNPHGQYIN